jgi:hypothetical protein
MIVDALGSIALACGWSEDEHSGARQTADA